MPKRSPAIFWLLLAATLAVDAVVFSWIITEARSAAIYSKVAFDALVVGQLSVVCIWSAVGSNKTYWVPALVATVAATLFVATLSDTPPNFPARFRLYLAVYGLQAASLLAGLWVLRGTSYWRRRTGAAHRLNYSLAQLMVAMGVVAVLAATIREGPFDVYSRGLSLGLSFSFAALAFLSAFLWSLPLHPLLRLAAAFGVALLLAVAFWRVADVGANTSLAIGSHYLIQAAVLSLWLGVGPILPISPAGSNSPPRPLPLQ